MAYRIGIPQGHAVRGAVACDEAVRNAGSTMIAVGRLATGEGVGGVGLEVAYAVTAPAARRDVQGMKAPTAKTTRGMKPTTMKTARRTKATATVETTAAAADTETATAAPVETAAATTVETAAATTVKAAASATARLGYVSEREPHDRARHDPSER